MITNSALQLDSLSFENPMDDMKSTAQGPDDPRISAFNPPPYRARAYGLDLWSDIPLPEFMPAGNGIDAVVRVDQEDGSVACAKPCWDFGELETTCSFPGVGKFQVRAGREIRVTPEPGSDRGLIRLYVEGMMMAILLQQRGFYVLHASVVQVAGRGVAFLGHIGAGKSTMALALEGRGCRLIADDNAAIDIREKSCHVTPAFPRVKVYPAIARTLGIGDQSLSPLHASQVKKTRQVESDFSCDPVQLDRIYILSRTAAPAIECLGKSEAVIELITNSIPTRWGLPGGVEQMKKSAALARSVPIYRVRTFHHLEEIKPLAEQIELHVKAGDQPKTLSCGAASSGE